MSQLDPDAYDEFQATFREPLRQRCRALGLAAEVAEREAERCLFNLGIMIPHCAEEIPSGGFEAWLMAEARNLTVRYWREQAPGEWAEPSSALPAIVAWKITNLLDHGELRYQQAALALALPMGWLRTQHRRMIDGIEQVFRQANLPAHTLFAPSAQSRL